MGSIITWIILALFAWGFSRVKKVAEEAAKEGKGSATPMPSSLGEAFPSIEVYNPNLVDDTQSNKKKSTDRPIDKRSAVNVKAPAPQVAHKPSVSTKTSGREHIAFRTKSEAKRAFIYSEIFNRKY